MQPVGVGDVSDEPSQVLLGLLERPVVVEGDLLSLERLEEALGFGILIGIADRRHADLGAGR